MAGSFDSSIIDQIVREVLAQLRQRVGTEAPVATHKESEPGKTQANKGTSRENGIELHDAVITEETLKQKSRPGTAIQISPKAILTPSARDYLRKHQIQLRQDHLKNADGSKHRSKQGILIAAHIPAVVQSLIAEVKRSSQALWDIEIESGVLQVVERIQSIICRGESPQVILFVKRPHRVACLVNRNSQCRAAVVQRGADVQTVRSEFGANVLCVDLQQPTYMGLREILRKAGETLGQIQEPNWSQS